MRIRSHYIGARLALRALASFIVVCACVPAALAQTTWYVDDDNCPGPGTGSAIDPFCLIQTAINAASAGDIVVIVPGTYSPSTTGEAMPISIDKSITLMADPGGDVPVIDADGLGRVLHCESLAGAVTIKGLQITGGFAGGSGAAGSGAGMYCRDVTSLTLTGCVFTGNVADGGSTLPPQVVCGGGLFCEDVAVQMDACSFLGNTVIAQYPPCTVAPSIAYGAGIYAANATLTLVGCDLIGNTAEARLISLPCAPVPEAFGGGMYCESSSVNLTGCTIESNVAGPSGTGHGGGMCCLDCSLVLTGNTLSDNEGYHDGGGMYCVWTGGSIEQCDFTGNQSNYGGAGGGVYCATGCDSLTVAHCDFTGNHATGAGAICCSNSSPSITACTISGNSVYQFDGGAIWCQGGAAHFSDCTITSNECTGYGGGVYCSEGSTATFERCVIAGNLATGFGSPPYYAGRGGGIAVRESSPTFASCAVTGNRAGSGTREGHGGGLYTYDSSPDIYNCTFSGNAAYNNGGGIYGACTPRSTIIRGNCVDIGEGYEWYGDGGCHFACYNDVDLDGLAGFDTCLTSCYYETYTLDETPLFVDPRPCSEAPTAAGDYHLLSGSPCTDMGDPNHVSPPCETDYDGQMRVWDGDGTGGPQIDIGADEFAAHIYGDMNCDGAIDNFDIDAFVLALTDSDAYYHAYPECNRALADADCDGSVSNFDIDPFVALLAGG